MTISIVSQWEREQVGHIQELITKIIRHINYVRANSLIGPGDIGTNGLCNA
jgi:hypothetical protein